MAHPMTTSVARQLGSLFEGGSVGRALRPPAHRAVRHRPRLPAAEAAFAALVARHGPMVLGVCRQLLGDRHHAEDAFQAVFLVLARKARSIRDPDLLGNWLYGVAFRTARQGADPARPAAPATRRTAAANRPEACPAALPADRAVLEGEQAEALHDEIDRLPASSRLPVVLCYFEGLTLAEAARRLRCPAGTVHSRLARAREKLRCGLIRRGVVLSTTAMAAALRPDRPRRPFLPSCAIPPPGPRSRFAARHAAAGGRSPHPPRRWPRRS